MAVRIAARARRDILHILAQSNARFGEIAADRYHSLILLAFTGLREGRLASAARQSERLPSGVHLLHLRSVPRTSTAKVGRPRHVVVFRYDGGDISVLRVLHDRMDFVRHLR